MLTELLIALFLGFLSGLGLGGGSLLMLYLILIIKMDPGTARVLNLLFYIPAALAACTLRAAHGNLRIRPLLPAAASGAAAAILFALLSEYLDMELLKKFYGAVLLLSGFRELFYRPRKAR